MLHPICFCFDHAVECCDSLSHGGDECDFVLFAFVDEPVEKFVERWIASHGSEGCHVQHGSDVGATSFDVSLAGFFGTVIAKGGDADKCRDLLTIQFAEFRQSRDEHLARLRSDTRHGLQDFILFTPIGVVVNPFCDTIIHVSDLFFKHADDLFHAFGNVFLVRLLPPVFFLGTHSDELLPSRDEITHLLCFTGWDGSRCQALPLCKPREHWCINGVGFGKLSETFCKIAGLPRVDVDDDESLGGEVDEEFPFESSCGLEDDLFGLNFIKKFDKSLTTRAWNWTINNIQGHEGNAEWPVNSKS